MCMWSIKSLMMGNRFRVLSILYKSNIDFEEIEHAHETYSGRDPNQDPRSGECLRADAFSHSTARAVHIEKTLETPASMFT